MLAVEEMVRPHEEAPGGSARAPHVAVLRGAVLEALGMREARELEGWIVDATLGAAGHARTILEAFPRVQLLGADQDPAILRYAMRALADHAPRARVRHARFSQLDRLLHEEQVGRVVGVLADLGMSSLQIDDAARGFSFQQDGPLDMRMDPQRTRSAADVINGWDEQDLADLFYYEGDVRAARKLARAIVDSRRRAPFLRTLALAELVQRVVPRSSGGTHPATQVFQALRRAVNEEGEELQALLETSRQWLVDEGVLIVISFHSGEDRVVKRFLAAGAAAGEWRLAPHKPVRAAREELAANPRASSAVLRSARRTRHGAGRTRQGAGGVP